MSPDIWSVGRTGVSHIRDEELLKAFGRHLAKVRRRRKLTQKQVAMDAELEISQVSRMERGLINARLSSIAAVANALNVPLEDLFNFKITATEE